ncbi:MAG: hypothetical protein ACMVO3_23420 [Thalassobaculum sp.]
MVVIIWAWPLARPFPADFTALMGVSGTAAAVLLGFLGAAKAIVLGLTGTPVFQRLKAAGYHDDLLGYMRVAVYGSVVLLIVSLAGLFVEPGQNPAVTDLVRYGFEYVWVLSTAFAILSFMRITNNLFRLIRNT